MSASEKLKARDAAMRIDVPTSRPLFEKARNAEHDVLRALPQIVEVVQEAERLNPVNGALWVALAALDEALS